MTTLSNTKKMCCNCSRQKPASSFFFHSKTEGRTCFLCKKSMCSNCVEIFRTAYVRWDIQNNMDKICDHAYEKREEEMGEEYDSEETMDQDYLQEVKDEITWDKFEEFDRDPAELECKKCNERMWKLFEID